MWWPGRWAQLRREQNVELQRRLIAVRAEYDDLVEKRVLETGHLALRTPTFDHIGESSRAANRRLRQELAVAKALLNELRHTR